MTIFHASAALAAGARRDWTTAMRRGGSSSFTRYGRREIYVAVLSVTAGLPEGIPSR
jgi:hypothetical protein